MRTVSKASLIATGVLLLTVTGGPAYALGVANSHANVHAQTAGQTATPGSGAGTKLATARLKACQNHEKAIDAIMTRIAARGQKHLDLFTTIAVRVENFYATKGKTLSTYGSLVSEVNSQKDAAQATVDALKTASTSFKCDGTDPKGAAQSFKADLKSEISALQTYRTSVKNLIVGVASVQGTTSSSGSNNTQGGQQ